MTGKPVTTLHDYQLSMLHAMCESAPVQSAALLERLGATRIDTAIAEKRWWWADAINNFTSIDEYVRAWGAPTSERIARHGDREIGYARWDLSFWPGLQIEFMDLYRGHGVFRNLLRSPELPRPQIDSVADLTPWSCTSQELQDCSLGPVDHVDGFGSIGDVIAFTAIDPETGCRQTYFARLDWGLLQSVKPAPGWYLREH